MQTMKATGPAPNDPTDVSKPEHGKDTNVAKDVSETNPGTIALEANATGAIPNGTEVRVKKVINRDLIPRDPLDVFFDPPPGLNPDQSKSFRAMLRDVNFDINPEGFVERNWCRDIAGLNLRHLQIEATREAFIQSRGDVALGEILIAKTNEDIASIFDRIRDGDEEAIKSLEEMKAKFGITDNEIRAQAEIRYRDQISKFDAEMRVIEQARDRIIELIERRRFVISINERMKRNLPAKP